MPQYLKYSAWLAGICAVLLVSFALVLFLVFDPNAFKSDIETAFKEKTGRTIVFGDDLALSFFPTLKIAAARVRIDNPPGFGDTPFAFADRASLRIKPLPLLAGKVRGTRIYVKGLTVNLAVNKAGQNNWSDFDEAEDTAALRETAPAGPSEKSTPAIQEDSSGEKPRDILPIDVVVNDAHIAWNDVTGHWLDARNLDLSVDKIQPDKPAKLALRFDLSAERPKVSQAIEFTASLNVGSDAKAVTINDLRIITQPLAEPENQTPLIAEMGTSLAIDLERKTLLSASPITLKIADVTASATLKAESLEKDPVFSGTLRVDDFSPRTLMKSLKIMPPNTADAEALTAFGARVDFEASDKSASFENLAFRLDDTHGTGRLSVADFQDPTFNFVLDIDRLDADRYRRAKSGKKEKKERQRGKKTGKQRSAADEKNDVLLESLRALDLTGTIAVDDLTLRRLRMKSVRLGLDANDGVLRARHSVEHFYQGAYSGIMTLNANGDNAVVHVDETLTGVQLEPFLRDLTGNAKLTGTARIRAVLSGRGNTADRLKSTLNGRIDAHLKNGVVRGFNLHRILTDAKAHIERLAGKRIPYSNPSDSTPYSEISMTAYLKDGIVRSDDLVARSQALTVSGAGHVDLRSERIRYNVMAKLAPWSRHDKNQRDEIGIPLGIKIRGNLDKPRYRLALDDTFVEQPKALLKEKKEELIEHLDKKLGRGARKLFEKIF